MYFGILKHKSCNVGELFMKVRRFFLLFFVVILLAACGADSDNENNNNGEEKESTTFRNIDIVTEDDDVKITGEMNSWDGNFYYHLLSGEEVIMDEEEVETEHKIGRASCREREKISESA